MKRIQLPDNTYEFISDNNDLLRLVNDKLGNDAGIIITDLITDLTAKADYESRKLDTDLLSYESSLEDWNNTGNDIMDIVSELQAALQNSKRLNRDDLINKVNRIQKLVYEVM